MLNLNKGTKAKPKPKPTLIFKNCSCEQHRQNSSDNFPLILQTIIIAQMMSTGGKKRVPYPMKSVGGVLISLT